MKLCGWILATLILAGCSESLEDADKRMESMVKGHQYGSSPDVWMEKYSSLRDEWDRVGLIYGMNGDMEACTNLVTSLSEGVAEQQWRCRPAN
jgi:hypothetical protein